MELSHLDAKNRPAMVNVGGKAVTRRTAHAVAVVVLPPELAAMLQGGDIATKKGSIFQTAILAGVMGAKRTAELIRGTTWTAPAAELRDRMREIARAGYNHLALSIGYRQPARLEEWAEVMATI